VLRCELITSPRPCCGVGHCSRLSSVQARDSPAGRGLGNNRSVLVWGNLQLLVVKVVIPPYLHQFESSFFILFINKAYTYSCWSCQLKMWTSHPHHACFSFPNVEYWNFYFAAYWHKHFFLLLLFFSYLSCFFRPFGLSGITLHHNDLLFFHLSTVIASSGPVPPTSNPPEPSGHSLLLHPSKVRWTLPRTHLQAIGHSLLLRFILLDCQPTCFSFSFFFSLLISLRYLISYITCHDLSFVFQRSTDQLRK
jgi:hypothetical protein